MKHGLCRRWVNKETKRGLLSIRGDDGPRVFVDNNVMIDEWHYEATGDAYVLFKYAAAP